MSGPGNLAVLNRLKFIQKFPDPVCLRQYNAAPPERIQDYGKSSFNAW